MIAYTYLDIKHNRKFTTKNFALKENEMFKIEYDEKGNEISRTQLYKLLERKEK